MTRQSGAHQISGGDHCGHGGDASVDAKVVSESPDRVQVWAGRSGLRSTVSVAKLALEHGVNTNLLFRWRRPFRMGMFGAPDPAHLPLPVVASPADVPPGA